MRLFVALWLGVRLWLVGNAGRTRRHKGTKGRGGFCRAAARMRPMLRVRLLLVLRHGAGQRLLRPGILAFPFGGGAGSGTGMQCRIHAQQ